MQVGAPPSERQQRRINDAWGADMDRVGRSKTLSAMMRDRLMFGPRRRGLSPSRILR